eukprot:3947683-Amphidinium_carterae.1
MARTEEEAEPQPAYRPANQGERPTWWPEDQNFYPGRKSRRPLRFSTETWTYHSWISNRRETAAMERDWLAQLRTWQAEGKDVDAIYSTRPKPAPVTSTPEVKPTNDDVIVPVVSCNRNIIEFCCDKHSTLGKPTSYSRGCRVTRITEKEDGTSHDTLLDMMNEMRSDTTMVWSAIPGGTPWRRLHDAKHGDDPEYRERMRQHDKTFDALWDNFVQIAEH